MPSNVAVERPNSWVICFDLDGNVATGREDLNITTCGVRGASLGGSVPGTGALGQNEHVVSVNMHWVCDRVLVVDYDDIGFVTAKVVDIPLVGEIGNVVGSIAGLQEWEDRIVVICTEGRSVNRPDEVARGVDGEADADIDSCISWWRSDREVWYRRRQWIITAIAVIDGPTRCGRVGVRIGILIVDDCVSIRLEREGASFTDAASHPV